MATMDLSLTLVPMPGMEVDWGPQVSLLPSSSRMGRSSDWKYWNVCSERGAAPGHTGSGRNRSKRA